MNYSYLLVLFYKNKYMKECKKQEIILVGSENTINFLVKEQINRFEFNSKNKYKVEQYSLFKHIKSEILIKD
jgi:hypothetical protein